MTIEQNEDRVIQDDDQNWLRMKVENLTFGRLLKAHRLCEDINQKEAAKLLGVSEQLLSAYENGRKLPSPKTAYEIGQKLGILPESTVLAVLNDELRRDNIPLQVDIKKAG